ncbi:hypothetical protein [Mesorhizobium sp. ANAO-SY3R2]|uniref:hypothetical protein n=1 Tax=Mesorhizobium sp. ANAO-SY3R2 TaxID=3166644 RepID=UPI0036704523
MSATELKEHPLFPSIDKHLALHLIAIHDQTPRLARLKASHRKWLMTQALYALTLERTADDPRSGLTPSNLVEITTSIGAVSHNTAKAFLEELLSYKFLQEIPNPHDKRVRLLDTTDASREAMMGWFLGHMSCLDELDGGGRHQRCLADERIFRLSQPRAARRLIANPLWRYPPESTNSFLKAELGGMILHEIVSRIDDFTPGDGRVVVGPASFMELAQSYFVSASNLKRMFKEAEASGLLGWSASEDQRILWVSSAFLDDYFLWQSQKFAALDEAYAWSVRKLAGDD